MSTRLKSLRTLVKVRERQAQALEREFADARARHEQACVRLQEATGHERACLAGEARAVQDRHALTSGAFTPYDVRAMDFRIEDCRARSAEAARARGDASAAVQRAAADIEAARAAVRRNEQRIEAFREEIAKLLRDHAAAQDEQADEEAEEAAISRFVARVRLARAQPEASHG
ncbi:MAG: hypothetical protein ACTHL8_01585 [Burkholderiaceae bacterium]